MQSFGLLVLCFIFAFVDAQEGPPSAKPRNVQVETISNSSLRVTWEAPSKSDWSGEISGYRLIYKELDLDPDSKQKIYHKTVKIACTTENCTFDLIFLKVFTEYSVNVIPFNSIGSGPASDTVNQTTAEGIPDAPDDVKCEAISSTKLRVSWKSLTLESLHGRFKNYDVSYITSHWYARDRERKYRISTANEILLNGLKKNTEYAINVLATTGGGDGDQSKTIYCQTKEDVPDEPVDVKVLLYGTEKVLVLWHAPLSQERGEVLHYTIHYRKSGGEAKTGKVFANQTSYEIFGLETNEQYEFWVTATSKIGEGLSSEYITGTPSNQVPPNIATYNDSFTMKFKERATLVCDAVGSPAPNVTWKVNGDNLIPNDRLQILANGTLIIQSILREDANNYTCVAENAFGNDSITIELNVLAPPKSPKVTILSTTTDKITLQLELNSTDSTPNYGFYLFYKLDSEIERWQKVLVFESSPSAKIDNCICGSSYLIYAHGYNYLGDGDHSEIITVKTNGSKPIAPTMSDFLEPAADGATLHLSTWNANGCPISYFFVEYKVKSIVRWVKIREKLEPNTEFVLNLKPATLYDIRVTAHNAAGSTVTDYEVETLTEHGGTTAPLSNVSELSDAGESTTKIESK